jgi:hypothetical protein
MKKRQDTYLGRNKENLKSEIFMDDRLIYEILIRRRMT